MPSTVEARPWEARAAARELLPRLDGLRTEVAAEAEATLARWRPRLERAEFAEGAANLVAYLALRHHDLRPLQAGLIPLGLSSLGRLEGRVLANLDAAAAALAAVAEAGRRPSPGRDAFDQGEALLRAATERVFGPSPGRRQTRLLVTCPTEAADDPAFMAGIVAASADAVRINCAHDDAAAWARMIANLRAAEAGTGRRLSVLTDLGGPRIRTGEVRLPPDRKRLHAGDRLLLVKPGGLGAPEAAFQAECREPAALDRARPGEPVLVDDGKARGEVEAVGPAGVTVQLDRASPKGLRLKPEKGLTSRGTTRLPALAPGTGRLDFVARPTRILSASLRAERGGRRALPGGAGAGAPEGWRRLGIVPRSRPRRRSGTCPICSSGRRAGSRWR